MTTLMTLTTMEVAAVMTMKRVRVCFGVLECEEMNRVGEH
jgi:hypothetical protein